MAALTDPQEQIEVTDYSTDAYLARMAIVEAAALIAAPHARMRPRLFRDGSSFCALYGENIMDGCAGFGATPEQAMMDFDRQWTRVHAPTTGANK